ncbi:hypothetical protein [Acidocella sp.]|uniref:hypothetical protein n=1 Tax=Acidocella sp. TaxID=50710 RepID=UPI003CFFF788
MVGLAALRFAEPARQSALPAWSMKVSDDGVETAVRYTACWRAMIGGNIGS